jgi:nucleoid DNA-binding protein
MNVRGGDGTNETTTTTTSSDDKKTTRNPQTGKEIRIPA